MAAEEEEEKAILAVIHQHLLQVGYSRAAKVLLEESGQKTFPSFSVPLQEIFAHWNKSQPKKRKAADRKRKTPAKIRVPDPKSSSESSEEEEVTNAPKTNVPANNSSVVNAESSSDDEDSSSEEEADAEKMVKTSVTRSKPSDFLQLAAQKTNSFPGKGVAVASVQAKGQQNKASVNKLLSPAVAKVGQNEVLPGKLGPVSQSPVIQGWNVARVAATKTDGTSESSSSSSESEEEKALKVVKTPPPPKPAQKEAESSSEDSSDDSDSEDGGATAAAKAATVQLKPGVQSTQVKTTLAKSLPASAIHSKGSSVKVSPAKTPANQMRSETENAAKSTAPTESSETSNSSDSEDTEPSSVAQTKSPRKIPQAATAVVKNAAASKPSSKTVSVSSPLKQTPKPSLTKSPNPSKKAESSESNESSSESEDETHPVPVSQKGLQTPRHSAGAKQNHADKPGNLVNSASSILKGKEAESESSSSSDSEDETVPAALKSPPPSATKVNTPAQFSGATKSLPLQVSLQKAQQSEDSSQDSSDETDSEEHTVLTQKPSQVAQKPVPVPMKATTAKSAGDTPGKAGSALSARKGTNATKSAAASLQKASEISETDSSESSNSEAAAKPVKQPPIHPFFKQVAGKVASASAKGAQVNSGTSESVSSKCQSPATVITGKVEQNSSKKAKPNQDQALPSKPSGLLKGKESSGSSSEEEEAVTASATVKQIPQPAGLAQKGGEIQEVESSSEESSDEDQEEPSQSLLGSPSGPFKTPTSTVMKTASPVLSKHTPGKAGNLTLSALTKSSGKSAIADSSSSDSSDSDTDAEETIAQKAEITSPASRKQTVGAKQATGKGTVAGEKRSGRDGSKASTAKKTTAKTQSNGKAKGTPTANLPLTLLPKVHSTEIDCKNNERAVTQVPGTGAQESTGGATPIVAMKTPKATKMSKSGEKKKVSKKRKLAAGETVLGEPKEKKQKGQSILDMLTKKKKKKKSKSSNVTKPPKNKDSKEKKSDKKKKKNKKLESLSEDGSQKKKKKKKKKTCDLERAA